MEHHEEGRNCPNTAKYKYFVLSGARDPRQPVAPSRWGPDLVRDPFPRPSLSPGNLQTRPTGPNRIVVHFLGALQAILLYVYFAEHGAFVEYARPVE